MRLIRQASKFGFCVLHFSSFAWNKDFWFHRQWMTENLHTVTQIRTNSNIIAIQETNLRRKYRYSKWDFALNFYQQQQYKLYNNNNNSSQQQTLLLTTIIISSQRLDTVCELFVGVGAELNISSIPFSMVVVWLLLLFAVVIVVLYARRANIMHTTAPFIQTHMPIKFTK